jgi:signal transduction histidine kinase/ActR/RegA family two-component response regulator
VIRDVARPLAPVAPETTGAEVHRRFDEEPDTLAIAVVGPDGRPVGLIERNAFFLRMAENYGRALFAGRACALVMDRNPILVDADVDLGAFLGETVATSAAELLRGFVAVEDGRYFGVGTALDLLVASFGENKRRAVESAAARDAAEAANRAKTEFLANMSHEIRTPLNGVLGVAGALGRTSLNARQTEMVRIIETSADSLQVLLSDMLDLARVEAGRLELTPEPFDLRETVMGLIELFRPKAEEKGLEIGVHVSRLVARRHRADAVRLKQILGNLLSNAVKFTAAGRVSLSVAADDAADGAQTLRLSVEDTGIGFDAATAKRLFARFAQADGSITRRFGGTGLGLSISSALAALMGGTISAVSTPGEGSRFTLTLALPTSDAEAAPEAAAEDLGEPEAAAGAGAGRPLRILLAEDHAVNRKVVQLIFDGLPIELDMAEDGAQAVRRFAAGAYDLVLMDIQMPVMDGLEATRAIRVLEADEARVRTPVVMLTANALPEHQAAGRAAGADGFLAKPIVAGDLLAAVQAAVTDPAEAAAA